MRAVRMLPVGLALLAGVLGCSRTINYTAGVCDCNPPAVESVLIPPPRPQPPVILMPPAQVLVNPAPRPDKLPQANQPPLGGHFPQQAPALDPLPAPALAPNDNLPR